MKHHIYSVMRVKGYKFHCVGCDHTEDYLDLSRSYSIFYLFHKGDGKLYLFHLRIGYHQGYQVSTKSCDHFSIPPILPTNIPGALYLVCPWGRGRCRMGHDYISYIYLLYIVNYCVGMGFILKQPSGVCHCGRLKRHKILPWDKIPYTESSTCLQ